MISMLSGLGKYLGIQPKQDTPHCPRPCEFELWVSKWLHIMQVIDNRPDHWVNIFHQDPQTFDRPRRDLNGITCGCKSFLGELQTALDDLVAKWANRRTEGLFNLEWISPSLRKTDKCVKAVAERRSLPTRITDCDTQSEDFQEWLERMYQNISYRPN
jgi:hypothetical protein